MWSNRKWKKTRPGRTKQSNCSNHCHQNGPVLLIVRRFQHLHVRWCTFSLSVQQIENFVLDTESPTVTILPFILVNPEIGKKTNYQILRPAQGAWLGPTTSQSQIQWSYRNRNRMRLVLTHLKAKVYVSIQSVQATICRHNYRQFRADQPGLFCSSKPEASCYFIFHSEIWWRCPWPRQCILRRQQCCMIAYYMIYKQTPRKPESRSKPNCMWTICLR